MFIINVLEQGGIILSEKQPKFSKFLNRMRAKGKRFQLQSLLRLVEDDSVDPEVKEMVEAFHNDLTTRFAAGEIVDLSDWVSPTDEHVELVNQKGDWITLKRCWAEMDDEKFEKAVREFSTPKNTTTTTTGGRKRNQPQL
jgi:hypothetical protein